MPAFELSFKKAIDADKKSAFGGIVFFNRKVSEKLAKKLSFIFLEVIVAPEYENKAFKMIEGKYNPTFTLANLKKDITTMTNTAKKLGIELPMINKAEELYKDAINEGLGDLDYTGIIEYIKKINNSKN